MSTSQQLHTGTRPRILSNESLIGKLDNATLWNNLKNKDDPDLQIKAAKDFKSLLLSFSCNLSTEKEWNIILTSMDEKIKGCVFSTLPHEIIGGILLISELIGLISLIQNNLTLHQDHGVNNNNISNHHHQQYGLQEFFSRYATYLREILLKCNLHDDRYKSNTTSVISLCTQTLANLVPLSGNYAKRIVESDIKQSIKWISSSYNKLHCSEQHKIAAVWILSHYAVSVPILFNVHINEIIVTIVNAIRDKSELVRIGGCKVLKECLKLISKRPHREQTSLSSRIVTDGYQGLLNYHSSNIAVKHGSLLTFQCVLDYCCKNNQTIPFCTKDFEKLCKLTLNEKDNRKSMIKLSVIKLLPLFAAYETSKFIKFNFLDQSLTYLIKTLQDTNSRAVHGNTKLYIKQYRNESFKAIGKIAIIVGPKMIKSTKSELDKKKALKTLGRMLQATKNQSQLTKIIKIMQESFDLAYDRKKQNKSYKSYIKYPLKCLSMLANALYSELTIFLNHQLILKIFDLGLTKSILKCIQNIYINVVQYQPLIQDRLSRMVWMILLYNIDNTDIFNDDDGNDDTKIDDNIDHDANIDDNIDHDTKIDDHHDHGTNIDDHIDHDEYSENNQLNIGDENGNNDAHDDDFNNIMYYHYKNKNQYFQPPNVINSNQYYMATNRYYLGLGDEHKSSSIKSTNINEDIPPFVSPPITSKFKRSGGGYGIFDDYYNLPSIGPRKPSDDILLNEYYYESSVGSGLSSPITAHQHHHQYHHYYHHQQQQQQHQNRRRSSINREQHQHHRHKNISSLNNTITELQDKELRNPKLIKLALETMSKFNLHDVNINLLYFVRETVLFYANHHNVSIRKQAGITCCNLLVRIIQQMDKEEAHLKQHWMDRSIIQ